MSALKHRTAPWGWRRVAWITPYIALWLGALLILRGGAMRTDCAELCVVADGWLWYTVFYAALSLSAFVGAIEVVLWILRLDRVSTRGMNVSNH
jgi:hypothetical protein